MKTNNEITLVKCERCGKVIPVSAIGIPVDYVWRDGVALCHECNKKEAKK